MSKAAEKRAEQEGAREYLRAVLHVGQPVYVVQRHVSSSGMSRRLTLFVVKDDKPHDITRKAALATGLRFRPDDHTMVVGGAGMDMHFHAVYSLSRALWPEGHPCTGDKDCPSNDHTNAYGEAAQAFDRLLRERGEERLDYRDPGGEEQFAERSRFITEQTAVGGPLGYRTDRIHSDGGYALKKETF